MNHVHAYPVAAALTLFGPLVLSACGFSTPSEAAAGAPGMGVAGASIMTSGGSATGGSAGSAGSAEGGSVTGGNGGAGTGGTGTGGADAGAGGAVSGGASGSSGAPATAGSGGGGGASGAGGGSAAGGGSGAAGAPATADMIKASCPMYTGGTKALAAADFCTLFQATCVNYIDYEPLTGCAADPPLWATSYKGWTTSQQDCRSQHLCAATAGSASTECHYAQGFGGKCM